MSSNGEMGKRGVDEVVGDDLQLDGECCVCLFCGIGGHYSLDDKVNADGCFDKTCSFQPKTFNAFPIGPFTPLVSVWQHAL